MKKVIALIVITLLLVNCSDSDDAIDSDILTSFIEPNLEFGISKSDLYNKIGLPKRERSGTTTLGLEAVYDIYDGGIYDIAYGLNYTSVNQTEPVLTDVDVSINASKENLNFLISLLNSKYGSSDFSEGITKDWYAWESSNYEIELNYLEDTSGDLLSLELEYQGSL